MNGSESLRKADVDLDAPCNYGRAQPVAIMPAQWPPSRLGDPIADYLNGENVEVTGSSVRFITEDGTDVILWSNDEGNVDWEQRSGDGWFENSFDQDDNGYIDDLRVGHRCLTARYERHALVPGYKEEVPRSYPTPSAAPDPNDLTHPHAVLLESRSIYAKLDESIDRGDIQFRVLWSDFLPAVSSETIASIDEIRPVDAWTSGAESWEVLQDPAGFSVRVTNVDLGNWHAVTPLVELKRTAGEPVILAIFSEKLLQDETIPSTKTAENARDFAEWHIENYQQTIARADAFIADPTTLPTEYDRSVNAHQNRLEEIGVELESERPGVALAWDSASRSEQASALELLRGAFHAELQSDLDELKAQLERQKVSSAHVSESIRDYVLAAHHSTLGGGRFTDLVNERIRVEDQLSYALGEQAARREQLKNDWLARRDTARAGLAEAEENLRNARRRLTQLAQRPEISYALSRHVAYEY